jgi:hypothetical protein
MEFYPASGRMGFTSPESRAMSRYWTAHSDLDWYQDTGAHEVFEAREDVVSLESRRLGRDVTTSRLEDVMRQSLALLETKGHLDGKRAVPDAKESA